MKIKQMEYGRLFSEYKESSISGRYITLSDIEPLLLKRKPIIIGYSVNGSPIYAYSTGTGKTKILLWSQMHGNETTATKALFDLFNLLDSEDKVASRLLRVFTFMFVPMLNPDGAKAYTRANANGVDLNRDFQQHSQPETRVLIALFESFQPDYCYNLHDQRTIFGAGNGGDPATISFLSPSFNEQRSLNATRKKAIHIIVAMNAELQKHIPKKIGRFDDSFNSNCVGDSFQSRGVPTILIEAGHFPGDYEREVTRRYFFIALIAGFWHLKDNNIVDEMIEKYLRIPQNTVSFFDFVYKNVKINYDGKEIITNFAAQYEEEISENQLVYKAKIVQIESLENFYGHIEIDAQGRDFKCGHLEMPEIGQKATFSLGNDVKIVNGLIEM